MVDSDIHLIPSLLLDMMDVKYEYTVRQVKTLLENTTYSVWSYGYVASVLRKCAVDGKLDRCRLANGQGRPYLYALAMR